MRIAIATAFGCALSWATRLQHEGADVLVFNDPGDPGSPSGIRDVGRGIVPLATGWGNLMEFAKEGQASRIPTLMLFDSSGLGEKADEARKAGLHVIAGGKVCDRMEKDRDFGFRVAESCGAMLPPHENFTTISEAMSYCEEIEVPIYFKSDRYLDSDATHGADNGQLMVEYLDYVRKTYGDRCKCMIQQKIEGVAISTARWFNGKEFVGPFEGTIEHKKFLNDDLGPSTGCSFNAVWLYGDQSEIAQKLGWDDLAGELRSYEAPPGIYDMNAIIDENGDAWFLEWCGRMGYDSEPTGQLLLGDLSQFLWHIATGQGGIGPTSDHIAFSTRLSVPPYPWEHSHVGDKKTCVGTRVDGADDLLLWGTPFVGYQLMRRYGELVLASPEGIVGLASATGRRLAPLNEQAIEFAKDTLRVPGLMFRTDGAKVIAKDAKEILKVIGDLPKGLLQ